MMEYDKDKLLDELEALEDEINDFVRDTAETVYDGLDGGTIDTDEAALLGKLVAHVANITYGNYTLADVQRARYGLLRGNGARLERILAYRLDEAMPCADETLGWRLAKELMDKGQPVSHPELPGRKFFYYLRDVVCEYDDGRRSTVNHDALNTVFQALLPHGWRTA
jgi:hypothetical protein